MSVELSLSKIVPFVTGGTLAGETHGSTALVWDGTTVWRSVDAEVWTPVLTLQTSSNTYSSALFHFGGAWYLTVSTQTPCLTYRSADDGETWAAWYSHPTAFFPGLGSTGGGLGIFKPANGYLFTREESGAVKRSADLSSWQTTNVTASSFEGVAYGGGVWVLHAGGSLYRSSDGLSYTLALSGETASYGCIQSVLWSETAGKFYAAFGYPAPGLYESADGASWARIPAQEESDYDYVFGNFWTFHRITEYADGVVLCYAWTSDGGQATVIYSRSSGEPHVLPDSAQFGYFNVQGRTAGAFDGGVLFAGVTYLYDPVTEQEISEWGFGPYTALMSLGPPPPVVVPEFWTNFNLSYEIP